MPDSNGSESKLNSSVSTDNPGANFVSPLQKASKTSPNSSQHSWAEQCYEVLVSRTAAVHDDGAAVAECPIVPIEGGSDAGMFCVVGSQFDPSQLTYHHQQQQSSPTIPARSANLQPGDIILSMNEYEISGYTRCDAVELCDILLARSQPSTMTASSSSAVTAAARLRIRLSPPQALATGSTMLSSFLATAFAETSAEYALQERIRENVYQRVVPCTCAHVCMCFYQYHDSSTAAASWRGTKVAG